MKAIFPSFFIHSVKKIILLTSFSVFSLALTAQTTTVTFTTPGTTTWVVPSCVTSITVQAWGGGGGGGGCASYVVSGLWTGNEACSAGGGGGGGGYASMTYTVIPGNTYTITVGSVGTAGPGSSSSSAACNGGAGGNSTFSGPATVGSGTLTAYGGGAGGGALIKNPNDGNHDGTNGAGGAGGSGLNGTTIHNGGAGATGKHDASCNDQSGGGGGGAGTTANGSNATVLVCWGSETGGAGGASNGGSGASGTKGGLCASCVTPYTGSGGNTIGGGGSGALIHCNDWFNTWVTKSGGAGARGEVWVTYATCSSLPVTLLDFNASYNNDVTNIYWSTASEINNKCFTIEKSTDGEEWTIVAIIAGAGNSNALINYNTIDENTAPGISYYRLKQTDYDGNFQYSKIVPLNVPEQAKFSIYPNPVTNVLNIRLHATITGAMETRILNVMGELVKVNTYNFQKGENLYKIDVENLKEGVYIMQAVTDNKVYTCRFIK